MNHLIMQFPDKDFRLNQSVMSVGELWKELAEFTMRRHDDNVAMSDDGKLYPLSTRNLQMRSFSTLSECLISTNNEMLKAAECYKTAFRTGFSGDIIRVFLSELTEAEKSKPFTVQLKFFQHIESADASWHRLFCVGFAPEHSVSKVISSLEQLAIRLDLIRDNFSYF